MNQTELRRFLIDALLDERPEYRGARAPADGEEQRLLLRALMNVRAARKCSPEFLRVQELWLNIGVIEPESSWTEDQVYQINSMQGCVNDLIEQLRALDGFREDG